MSKHNARKLEKISRLQKKQVGAVLAELSKELDCLNHDLLIAKFEAYGFNTKALTYPVLGGIGQTPNSRLPVNPRWRTSTATDDLGAPSFRVGAQGVPEVCYIYVCLCSCCIRVLVFMLHTCACVHVAYVCLCSCCIRVLVFMLHTCACVHVAYVCLCSC